MGQRRTSEKESGMSRRIVGVLTAIASVVAFSLLGPPASSGEEQGARRTVLTKQDLSNFPGHEAVLAKVEFAPGAREPKHTHPGDLFGFVVEGALSVSMEGKPVTTVNAGEVFFVPAGTVHWGENASKTPTRVIVTFVVEKGKPLTTPVQ
jgi:quercetin dioxygenase-like cupin family protein